MAQKKTTKQNKKQLKQKQRQYQKQSVVVNVNTGTKRRKRASSGGKKTGAISSVSTQLIQSVPLQYSPQMMLDQSSLLTQDSRNRIFQSEIRNGISFINEEREKNVANNNKREAWLTQQENIINENRLMGAEDILSRNMLPTPRDDSITNINQPYDRGSNSIYTVPDTTAPIRVIKKRNPPPMLPTPVDDSINMNAPVAAMEDPIPEAARETNDERVGRGKRPRNYGYPEFTLLENGKWRCNTCDPFKDVDKGSRGRHLDTKTHERNLLNPRPPFRV